jgi:hypothetical protein
LIPLPTQPSQKRQNTTNDQRKRWRSKRMVGL